MELTILSCIVLFALVESGASELLNGAKEIKEDWRPLHYKLFSNDKAALSVQETLETLKSLMDMYKGKTDDQTKVRLNRVVRLLDVTRLSEDRCTIDYFAKTLTEKLRFFSVYPKNIVPFIRHYKEKQFLVCEPIFLKQFDEQMKVLTDEEKIDLMFMYKTIDRIEKGFIDDEHMNPMASKRDAVIAYLELIYGPLDLENMFVHGTRLFREKYDEAITNKCVPLYNALKDTADVFENLFIYHRNLKSHMNGNMQKWLACYNMCRILINNSVVYIRSAYQENRKLEPEKISLHRRALLCLYPKDYRDRVKTSDRLLH